MIELTYSAPVASVSALPKSRGNVSGFGLGSKATGETDKPSSKRTLDFGEEESARKKLEKLPTPPLEDVDAKGDADQTNGVEDDDDVDMQDAGTEEETAAAARAAHEKREERLQHQTLALQADEDPEKGGTDVMQTNGDVDMKEPEEREPKPELSKKQEEEEEDIDALDAFMSGLSDLAAPRKGPSITQSSKSKNAQQQPEALFGDDDVDLDAVEGNPGDILAMASKARKKKDLPAVNHSKMKYEPFRKSFYTEPSELAMMTEEEVADLRLELDGIKVRVCPQEIIIYYRRAILTISHRALMFLNPFKNGHSVVLVFSLSTSYKN